MADFTGQDTERLLRDAGIVRHRGKIEAVINNARMAVEMLDEEGSLASYFWRFEPAVEEIPVPQAVSTSPASVALSKDLKRRGWRFVGPTTVFAFMQAMGLINDHVERCATRSQVAAARAFFTSPAA